MDQIKSLLACVNNPDKNKRKSAEMQLKALETDPNFIIILSKLFSDTDPVIRKTASILFKNLASQQWNDTAFEEQRNYIRDLILDILMIPDRTISVDIESLLAHILDSEPLKAWSVMQEKATSFIRSNNINSITAALKFYDAAFSDDKVKYDDENLNDLFNPISKDLMTIFYSSYSNKDYLLAKKIMKIYTNIVSSRKLVVALEDSNYFMQILKVCLESITLEEEDVKLSKTLYQLKKWSIKFAYNASSKAFGNSNQNQEIKNYLLNENNYVFIYNAVLDVIKTEILKRGNEEIKEESESLLKACCNFLTHLINDSKNAKHYINDIKILDTSSITPDGSKSIVLSDLILKDINFLIYNFIYPLQIFTEDDEDLFNGNPKKYLRERYNYYTSDLRGYTNLLFSDLVKKIKKNKPMLANILSGFENILNQYKNNPTNENACSKFAAISLINTIAHYIEEQTTEFLKNNVFPDLLSQYPFLQSLSLYALQFFKSEKIDDSSISHAFEQVMRSMKSDNLIIKVDSSLAISFFYDNLSIQESLKNHVPYIIENLLDLQRDHELEAINDTLEGIILHYPDEVRAFAPNLTACFANLILGAIQTQDDEKMTLVVGYFKAVQELLYTLSDHTNLVYEMYCRLYEVLTVIFKNQLVDLYPDTLVLLSSILFTLKNLDESMISLYYLVMAMDKDEILGNADELLFLLDNYISFGKEAFVPHCKPILDYIHLMCNPEPDMYYDDDHINGCKIIESLLLNTNGGVLEHIPFFLVNAMSCYNLFDRDSCVMVYYLESIMHCCMIDFDRTWNLLIDNGKLEIVIKDMYEMRNRFTRVLDKKIILIFIGSIMKRGGINIDTKRIKRTLVINIETLPAAIEKRRLIGEDAYEEKEDAEHDELEEDLEYKTPLDDFNIFEYFRQVMCSLGATGMQILEDMKESEKQMINDILCSN